MPSQQRLCFAQHRCLGLTMRRFAANLAVGSAGGGGQLDIRRAHTAKVPRKSIPFSESNLSVSAKCSAMLASLLAHHVQRMNASSGLGSLKVLADVRKLGGLPFLATVASFTLCVKRSTIRANHRAQPSGLAFSACFHSGLDGSATSIVSRPIS